MWDWYTRLPTWAQIAIPLGLVGVILLIWAPWKASSASGGVPVGTSPVTGSPPGTPGSSPVAVTPPVPGSLLPPPAQGTSASTSGLLIMPPVRVNPAPIVTPTPRAVRSPSEPSRTATPITTTPKTAAATTASTASAPAVSPVSKVVSFVRASQPQAVSGGTNARIVNPSYQQTATAHPTQNTTRVTEPTVSAARTAAVVLAQRIRSVQTEAHGSNSVANRTTVSQHQNVVAVHTARATHAPVQVTRSVAHSISPFRGRIAQITRAPARTVVHHTTAAARPAPRQISQFGRYRL